MSAPVPVRCPQCGRLDTLPAGTPTWRIPFTPSWCCAVRYEAAPLDPAQLDIFAAGPPTEKSRHNGPEPAPGATI